MYVCTPPLLVWRLFLLSLVLTIQFLLLFFIIYISYTHMHIHKHVQGFRMICGEIQVLNYNTASPQWLFLGLRGTASCTAITLHGQGASRHKQHLRTYCAGRRGRIQQRALWVCSRRLMCACVWWEKPCFIESNILNAIYWIGLALCPCANKRLLLVMKFNLKKKNSVCSISFILKGRGSFVRRGPLFPLEYNPFKVKKKKMLKP